MTIESDCSDRNTNFMESDETLFDDGGNKTAWGPLAKEIGNWQLECSPHANHKDNQGFLSNLTSSLERKTVDYCYRLKNLSLA